MASKIEKDPIVENQEKAVKALNLEPVDPEVTTAREQRVVAEEADEPEPEPEPTK